MEETAFRNLCPLKSVEKMCFPQTTNKVEFQDINNK